MKIKLLRLLSLTALGILLTAPALLGADRARPSEHRIVGPHDVVEHGVSHVLRNVDHAVGNAHVSPAHHGLRVHTAPSGRGSAHHADVAHGAAYGAHYSPSYGHDGGHAYGGHGYGHGYGGHGYGHGYGGHGSAPHGAGHGVAPGHGGHDGGHGSRSGEHGHRGRGHDQH